MPFISVLTIIIIIPIVPVFTYVIGLLVPASHIVSRSCTFKISSKRLWQILTDVNQYPQWQPKVEKVIIDEPINTEDTTKQTVFVEYSTKKRHTVIIHHERIKNQCLLRILEERPVVTAFAPSKIPTFSGSWTFEIITNQGNKEDGDDHQVTLKITEQGVIKKPIVRVTHLLLFGFHRRIDRFMNDLHKKIDADNQEISLVADDKQEEELAAIKKFVGEDSQKHPVLLNSPPPHQKNIGHNHNENDMSAVTIDPTIGGNNDIVTTDDSQLVETNDTFMTESKFVDKEWDLMSEIYESSSPGEETT